MNFADGSTATQEDRVRVIGHNRGPTAGHLRNAATWLVNLSTTAKEDESSIGMPWRWASQLAVKLTRTSPIL